MREAIETQQTFEQTRAEELTFDPKNRGDIPAVLWGGGLQHVFMDLEVREKVLGILRLRVRRKRLGRRGMSLWRILVLAVLKQGLNTDYDRLLHLANKHPDVCVTRLCTADAYRSGGGISSSDGD